MRDLPWRVIGILPFAQIFFLKFPCFPSFSKNYFVHSTRRPVKIFRARPPWLPPLCFSRPRVAYVATYTRCVTVWSALSPLSPAEPRVQAREPTNYFRVYKINEKSVVDALPRSFSRAGLLLRARGHTPRCTPGICNRRVRGEKREKEREREKCCSALLNVFLARGRYRLCFPQQWPGPAQVLLTESPSSRHGRRKAASTYDYRELDCATRYGTNRGNKQLEVSVSPILVSENARWVESRWNRIHRREWIKIRVNKKRDVYFSCTTLLNLYEINVMSFSNKSQ